MYIVYLQCERKKKQVWQETLVWVRKSWVDFFSFPFHSFYSAEFVKSNHKYHFNGFHMFMFWICMWFSPNFVQNVEISTDQKNSNNPILNQRLLINPFFRWNKVRNERVLSLITEEDLIAFSLASSSPYELLIILKFLRNILKLALNFLSNLQNLEFTKEMQLYCLFEEAS